MIYQRSYPLPSQAISSFNQIIFCFISFSLLFTNNTSCFAIQTNNLLNKEIVLLKNEENLLPIRALDSVRLASLWIGTPSEAKPFQEMASRYAAVSHFFLLAENRAYLERFRVSMQENFDVLLVTISANASIEEIKAAALWCNGISAKIAIASPLEKAPAALQFFPQAHSVLVGEDASLFPQVIFGGIGTAGTLTDSLGSFRAGSGIALSPLGRLAYPSANALGIDSAWLTQRIDSVCHKAIASGAFPGCQVMGVWKGQVIFHKTYGFHTYRQERPVRHDDLYDLASVSKVTTALPALMRFHGEGRFDLSKTLGDYFRFLRRSDKKTLDLREVLAHQARLKAWIPYWRTTLKSDGSFKPKTLRHTYSKRYSVKLTDSLFLHRNYKRKIFKAIKKSPLLEEKKYVYSGLPFYLFPSLVEEIAQTEYETYLKRTFYESLGAYRLTFNPSRFFPKSRIVPTEHDTFFRKQLLHGVVHDEGAAMMGGVSANAGLFGTADDLAKLFQMYLNGGEYAGKRYIDAASIQEFTRYQFEGNHRGLGFDKPLKENRENGSVSIMASEESYGHSGYTGTFVWVDPSYDFIFMFLSNRVYPTRENRIIYQQNIRPTLHHFFYQAIKRAKEN